MKYFIFFLKGAGMGTANVIPGVSGGTIALITNVFERIINSIKYIFSIHSMQILLKSKLKEWVEYTDILFLLSLGAGMIAAIVSVAHLLEYLFDAFPVLVWSFFFGLVLASVYFVAKTISKWNYTVVLFFIAGTAIAASFALLTPASENSSSFYLFICGIVAACSMILPGISGSFVLVLMGNYEMVMIHGVNTFNLKVLVPVALGAGIGLLGFSYILSWVFRKFKNQTIAILSGFMLGSLLIIWPWKEAIYKVSMTGTLVSDTNGKQIVESYKYLIPDSVSKENLIAILMIICGIGIVTIMEMIAKKTSAKKSNN